eukprot:22361-Pleurochrysis_carterae.AAC.1
MCIRDSGPSLHGGERLPPACLAAVPLFHGVLLHTALRDRHRPLLPWPHFSIAPRAVAFSTAPRAVPSPTAPSA